MSFRGARLVGLLMLAMMVFGWLWFNADAFMPVSVGRQFRPGGLLGGSLTIAGSSELSEALGNQLFRVTAYLVNQKELLVYGGIGLVALLMIVLVVGSAASPRKEKSDALLQVLKQEKERAENLARLKSEFLNQVSHELRTPLAVIIGYIECMTDGLYGEIEAKHHEILQVVAKQSSHLKNMIDQILIYSRLESNKQAFRIEHISLTRLISDLRDTFDFLCRQKGLDLRWDLSDKVPTLQTDAERLKEILSNLLQNAVKYTDKGTIRVGVEHHAASDSIRIEVSDTGMGIPPNYLNAIFEPFMQVHKTSSDKSRGGIGLGLSIVKKHIEQLKGTITVESESGRGSTFRIVLPRVFDKRPLRGKRFLALVKTPFSRVDPNPSLPVDQLKKRAQQGGSARQTV